MSLKVSALSGVQVLDAKVSELKNFDDLERKILEKIPDSVCLRLNIFDNLQVIERLPEIPQGQDFLDLQFEPIQLSPQECVKNLIRKSRNDLLEKFDFTQFDWRTKSTFCDVAILAENLPALKILSDVADRHFPDLFEEAVRKRKFEVAKFCLTELTETPVVYGLSRVRYGWLDDALWGAVDQDNLDFLRFVLEHPRTLKIRTEDISTYRVAVQDALSNAVMHNHVNCGQFLLGFDLLGILRESQAIEDLEDGQRWRTMFLHYCPYLAKTAQLVELCLANGSVIDGEFLESAVLQGNVEKVVYGLKNHPEICSVRSLLDVIRKIKDDLRERRDMLNEDALAYGINDGMAEVARKAQNLQKVVDFIMENSRVV